MSRRTHTVRADRLWQFMRMSRGAPPRQGVPPLAVVRTQCPAGLGIPSVVPPRSGCSPVEGVPPGQGVPPRYNVGDAEAELSHHWCRAFTWQNVGAETVVMLRSWPDCRAAADPTIRDSANGRPTAATSPTRSTRRSIRSPPRTSRRCRIAWRAKSPDGVPQHDAARRHRVVARIRKRSSTSSIASIRNGGATASRRSCRTSRPRR